MRSLFIHGAVHKVWFSVREDGSQPAQEFLATLSRGTWEADPDRQDGDPWPDEAQPNDRAVLVRIITAFANKGVPDSTRQVNDLEDGLWEFKRAAKRVTFYDTDGKGACVTHERVGSRAEGHRGESDEMWQYPIFAEQIRLGFCFGKTGRYSGDDNIDEAIEVKEEDLAYDRAA
ncbi:hypothetical protein [Curtobacterium sp. MCPF17_011]|uniref:hypothetical protein n=1 Tax=Curtobacterium sp. MCPF17_011 TaxID=2175652 RepID=UPI0011B55790|nr:hypothetical protein [Curtobacterium sp. MCPF17_011]